MKVKKKVISTMVPILLLLIISINLTFSVFFVNYLKKQENTAVGNIKESISTYVTDKQRKYNGTVSEWGHWDEAFKFINNNDPDFIEKNITTVSFMNLDINFVIFEKDRSLYKLYYDFETGQYIDFPQSFTENFDSKFLSGMPTYSNGIFRLGDDFYFIAATYITDSSMKRMTEGRLFIGRKIDNTIVEDIENISGCSVDSIAEEAVDGLGHAVEANTPVFLGATENQKGDELNIRMFFPNIYNSEGTTVTLLMPRDLYINGLKQLYYFMAICTAAMSVLLMFIFLLFNKYLTKPINMLMREIKSINLTESLNKLSEIGNDEFGVLRKTINNLLVQLDAKHSEVILAQERLYSTLISVGDGVIAVDREERVTFLNPVAQRLTGWNQHEACGKPMEDIFRIINEFTRKTVESPVKAVLQTQQVIELSSNTLLIAKDGAEVPVEDTAAPIKNKNGELVGCVLVFRDYSERKERQRRIEYLSYHDQLTGLYNRRFFDEEMVRLDEKNEVPVSFIYADVNGLKTMNDVFGHAAGDDLLKKVGEVLSAECREDDIVCRTGGDEFIIILRYTEKPHTEALVKKIESRIENEKVMDINISLSFGWGTKASSLQSLWGVLKESESSMYQKKIYCRSSIRSAVIESILKTLCLKSPIEAKHSERVGNTCEAIGKAFGLKENELKALEIAGKLHDIGKIAVDEAILNKTEELTEADWAQIRNHPETGYRILGTSTAYNSIAECVLAHHERWDGQGYPKGLSGEQINWMARVIAVADTYDAMTYPRVYHRSMEHMEIINELKSSAGTNIDPDITRVFVEKVLGESW